MADATFEFSSDDDIRKLNEQVEKGNDELKKTRKKLSESEQLFAEVEAARARILKKRLRTRAEQFASGGGASQYNQPIGPTYDFSHMRQMHSDEHAAEKGLQSFTGAIGPAVAAIGTVTGAMATASTALRTFTDRVQKGYESYGNVQLTVSRAARELRMDRGELLHMVTDSPDRQGAMAFLNSVVRTSQMRGGIGIPQGGLANTFAAVRAGDIDWETAGSMFQQGRFAGPPRGFNPRSAAARFLDSRSAANRAMYDEEKRTPGGWKFALADAERAKMQYDHPLVYSVTPQGYVDAIADSNSAQRIAPYMRDGAPHAGAQAPFHPSNEVPQLPIDLTSGGRGVQAVTAAATAAATAATHAALRNGRKPDPRSGIRPGE